MKLATPLLRNRRTLQLALIVLIGAGCGSAGATQLTYYPINPSFGGSPLNGPVLMNSAQAQNKYTDSDDMASGGFDFPAPNTPLQDFNDSLQRSILSRVASSASSQVTGPNGQLIPGTVETTDFTISVIAIGGGVLKIVTTDKTTGAQTSFQVGQ